MRDFISIIVEFVEGQRYTELARRCDTVDKFIQSTDGMDVLYRGHYDDATPNHAFMTDYVGHAKEYAGDVEGRVDAFAFDPKDVLFFDDQRFEEMRTRLKKLSRVEFGKTYRKSLQGNRFASHYTDIASVWKLINSNVPYSKICGDPSKNDTLIPLMQWYADAIHGQNIIAFHGNDYAEWGGQTEYVVGDVSRLIDLRKLYDRVRG